MRHVNISDRTYDAAVAAAAHSGRSVEAFIEEAVQRLVEEETPLQLSAEQIAALHEAGADFEAANVYSLSDVRTHFSQKASGLPPSHSE